MGSEAMERAGASPEAAMGVGNGDGAPDSWEMVDLEASMKKLLAASSNLGYQQADRDAGGLLRGGAAQIAPAASFSAADSGSDEAFPPIDTEDVDSFLREALQGKDRLTILRLEQEVDKFMRNPRVQQLEFQPMPSSYLRLAAHRVVQHYNLQSSVADCSNPESTRIIARKIAESRFPRVRLADIPANSPAEEKQEHTAQQTFALKRRPNKSSKFNRESDGFTEFSSRVNPTRSVEERKEDYNRARARIFSNSDFGGKGEEESLVLESCPSLDPVSNGNLRYDKRVEQPSEAITRAEFYNGLPRIANVKTERESAAIYKMNNRVAIFRDREKDRKDPDYDRNYDRYMQRFDPGFGVSQAPYGMQAIYTPLVNYNTEFPQLAGAIRPQICVEPPLHRAAPQPVRAPWAGSSNGLGYGHPDSMMGSFNPGHLGSHSGSAVYMHPQQFSRTAPPMTYVHSQERFPQSISQPHLQPEGSFSQARRQ